MCCKLLGFLHYLSYTLAFRVADSLNSPRFEQPSLTAIPPWERLISSDLGSYAGSGLVSNWMGDLLGIPVAVSFWVFFTTYLRRWPLGWLIFK